MKFSKTRQVKSPQRGTSNSAGIDFFVPVFTKKFKIELLQKNQNISPTVKNDISHILDNSVILMPRDRILIPSGIHVNFLEEESVQNSLGVTYGLSLNANNKSGVASKLGLSFLASIVDSDYQGEIHISLVNTGKYPISINENDKIIQFLLQPVIYAPLDEVSFNDLYDVTSERGTGGFGSTDKK